MKSTVTIISIAILVTIGAVIFFHLEKSPQRSTIKPTMKVTSPAFEHNQLIPSKYTCNGENINPPLVFYDVPDKTKSLVLIVDDPDAPLGTWVHWVVFNIPKETRSIHENSTSQGIQAITSFGKPGYGGPCPPSGIHRYFFKLFALDTVLSLTGKADKKTVEEVMQSHILSHAELIGLYSKR